MPLKSDTAGLLAAHYDLTFQHVVAFRWEVPVERFGFEHHEATVDPPRSDLWFLDEVTQAVAFDVEFAKSR